MTDIPAIAARLTPSDKICLIDLAETGEPWLMGGVTWQDHESRVHFYRQGLVTSTFPEATLGNSGRQFWVFNPLGLALRDYLKEQST